jgi:hypothetical protein
MICKKSPESTGEAYCLSQNDKSFVTYGSNQWLMCQLCEKNAHFSCYCCAYNIFGEDCEKELTNLKEGKKQFICGNCRKENRD